MICAHSLSIEHWSIPSGSCSLYFKSNYNGDAPIFVCVFTFLSSSFPYPSLHTFNIWHFKWECLFWSHFWSQFWFSVHFLDLNRHLFAYFRKLSPVILLNTVSVCLTQVFFFPSSVPIICSASVFQWVQFLIFGLFFYFNHFNLISSFTDFTT